MNTIISLFSGYILGLATNYSYDKIVAKFQRKKKDVLPSILKSKNWGTSSENIYYFEKDPDFTIKIGEPNMELASRFSKFPDREHDRISWVEVRFKDAVLFGWNFMHLDGYRFFLPVPKCELKTDGTYYDYYDLNSTEVMVFNIIGSSILINEKTKIEGLKNIAKMLDIIVTEL